MSEIDRVARRSPDFLEQQRVALEQLFPEIFSEGKIDWDKLRATLGELVDDRPERYSFTWAGKTAAIRSLQTPSQATLVPDYGESIDFTNAQHIFIEGENLEVLKLLQKSYYGRVKMIYIDPPYNTGKDFVYSDNYIDPLHTYLALTGQIDSEGNHLTSNPETSGRYHSAWLSMMYPRLFLARTLLREDGVILVSIDDNEAYDLRMLMNEIFGEENFIAQLVWEKGRKNDAKLFSVGHEYMVVYARSKDNLRQLGTVWREPKPGAQEIWEEYLRLREKYGEGDEEIEEGLRKWYRQLPDRHPSKALSRYKRVDKYGPWRDRDISWPGGGGPTYDVLHPETGQPCAVPERGWGFATPEAMQRQIALGLVVFRKDHTEPPMRKAHLYPAADELIEDEEALIDEEDNGEAAEVGLQVMGSVIYKQSQVAVKYLRNLMGEKVFNNPKDHEVLARLIRYCATLHDGDIVLDFFAGSASTAEAVLHLNNEENGNLKFIMVQLPEPTPEGSVAKRAGYATVAEIAEERIRRAIAKYKGEQDRRLPLFERKQVLGFKILKMAPSNFKQWQLYSGEEPDKLAEQFEMFQTTLADGWRAEDVIYEVILKEGYDLNASIQHRGDITSNTVYEVVDQAREQSFLICLDEQVAPDTLSALALSQNNLFICLDTALDDAAKINLSLQCRLKTI